MNATIPPGFDKALALKLANASLLAYTQMNDPADFTMPPGYTLVAAFTADVLGNTETFGYLMKSATDAVLAFRGTDDFPDAIADIRYNQVAYPFVANAGLSHVGFTAVYQSARAAVLAAAGTLPARLTLYITGHSLGGGVATSGLARHRRQHRVQNADRLHNRQSCASATRILPIVSTATS